MRISAVSCGDAIGYTLSGLTTGLEYAMHIRILITDFVWLYTTLER